MKQYIDKSAVIAEIEKLQDSTMDGDCNFYSAKAQAEYDILCVLEEYLDTLEVKEEPASKDLGEYINELSKQFPEVSFAKLSRIAVRVAKWQKEQLIDKACNFFYEQLNNGIMECGDIETFINDFKKAMEE